MNGNTKDEDSQNYLIESKLPIVNKIVKIIHQYSKNENFYLDMFFYLKKTGKN